MRADHRRRDPLHRVQPVGGAGANWLIDRKTTAAHQILDKIVSR